MVLRCNMFTTPKSLLILSFLITIVNSTPRPGTQDFDLVFDDALDTNMFLDGVSNNDDIMASAPLMDMFDSDLTVDATPFMDQENLFALDTRPGSSCSAEDSQLLPAIGRLRRREGGESCVSPTKQRSDEGVDLFLQRLPIVGDAAKPKLRSRRDICPELIFGFRDIALCSAADTQIRRTIENTYIVTVSEAFFYNDFIGCLPLERLYCCRSVDFVAPGSLSAEKPWKNTGYDCLENTGMGFPLPIP